MSAKDHVAKDHDSQFRRKEERTTPTDGKYETDMIRK
jgi:hypothetical protein